MYCCPFYEYYLCLSVFILLLSAQVHKHTIAQPYGKPNELVLEYQN